MQGVTDTRGRIGGGARPPRSTARELAGVLAFAVAFLALVDLSWRFPDAIGRPIYWFPEGLAAGVLLRVERRRWPAFLAAIPIALLTAGAFGFPPPRNPPPAIHVVWAVENTAVPFAVAYALERAFGSPLTLTRTREVVGLVLATLVVVPAVGALFTVPAWWLWPEGRAADTLSRALLAYTAIYTTPVLAFVPVIVTWRRRLSERPATGHRGELAGIALLVAVLTGAGFFLRSGAVGFVALSVAAFPVLGWTAARFGVAIAAQGAFALSVVGTALTITGHGPFGDAALGADRIVFIQGFYAIAATSALIVGAEATAARLEAAERERMYHEAREAIRARDDFLSIASHELKTPLTPLSARLQWLRRRIAQGLPVEVTTVDKALASLDKLTGLINDLLDASRVERGGLGLHAVPLDLVGVVRAAIAAPAIAPDAHRLRLETPATPVWVAADGSRLAQVVENLISNAVKYSPRGGMVRVRVEPRGAEALLSVADEGIGIPPDQLPFLFQRFFRARNAATTAFGGLGLGLYISQDIVARHGGRIWAESELGRGSTFHVALPRTGPVELGSGGRRADGARAELAQ